MSSTVTALFFYPASLVSPACLAYKISELPFVFITLLTHATGTWPAGDARFAGV